MSPATTPAGKVHCICVGRPESPEFFQYVCHSGWCVSCRPTQTCLPAAMPSGAWAISSARTRSVVTTLLAGVWAAAPKGSRMEAAASKAAETKRVVMVTGWELSLEAKFLQGLFTLLLQDALRVKKVMRKARNAAGLDVRPGFATRRMAFLAATRRERGQNSATRCYAPSPGGQPGRRRAPRLALF